MALLAISVIEVHLRHMLYNVTQEKDNCVKYERGKHYNNKICDLMILSCLDHLVGKRQAQFQK